MVKLLQTPKYMGARGPLVLYLCPEVFATIFTGEANTKLFMTKISPKRPPISRRCHVPRALVLLCLFVLQFTLTKAQPKKVTILNLGPLYDCCQPQHLGMFVFSSVNNCSQSML